MTPSSHIRTLRSFHLSAGIALGLLLSASVAQADLPNDNKHFDLDCPSILTALPYGSKTPIDVHLRVDEQRQLICYGSCTSPPVPAIITHDTITLAFDDMKLRMEVFLDRRKGKIKQLLFRASDGTSVGFLEGVCSRRPYQGIDEAAF